MIKDLDSDETFHAIQGYDTIPCIRTGLSYNHPSISIKISWDILYSKYWDGLGW